MAEVATHPLVYHYGNSFDGLTWQWKGSDGIAKDITGYTTDMKVRSTDGTEVLHLSEATGEGLFILVGTDGTVTLNALPAFMLAGSLEEDKTYEYDITVVSPDLSIKKTLSKGPFRVDKRITDV